MKKLPKRYYYDAAGIALMLIVYFLLFWYCSSNDVVSQMLCGGDKSFTLLAAVLFIGLRLFIIVLLPSCILVRIGLLLNYLYLEKEPKENHHVD